MPPRLLNIIGHPGQTLLTRTIMSAYAGNPMIGLNTLGSTRSLWLGVYFLLLYAGPIPGLNLPPVAKPIFITPGLIPPDAKTLPFVDLPKI